MQGNKEESREPEAVVTTPPVVWGEPTPTLDAEITVTVADRRIVKLAREQTMYLVEDGIRRPVATSAAAAALGIAPEVVDEDTLRQWPEGDLYTGA